MKSGRACPPSGSPRKSSGLREASPDALDGRVGKKFIFGAIVAGPTFSYSRETKVTEFPIGLGFRKVLALGKKKQPVQVGAEAWLYAAQADALGPQWTIRITISPVIPIPWGKM